MAIVDPDIQVTDIDGKVCIITDPGKDEEEVIIRFDPNYQPDILKAMDEVHALGLFSVSQKMHIAFWMGYFYAHMGRR
jgi:hypothetical protein